MGARGWVVTCDPGVDDAVALAVLAAAGAVRGIVAGAGNVPAPVAHRNAAGIARLLGLDVPVGLGPSVALDGRPVRRHRHAHGADGLAGLAARLPLGAPGPEATPPAGDVPIEGAVLGLGPLTAVALALRRGARVDRVVWMGGALAPRPTVDPAIAEFNAAADPAAVDAVLAGVPEVAVVPVDVTSRVALREDDLRRWAAGGPVAAFCAELAARRRADGGGAALHDPVAAVAALEPDLLTWEERSVACPAGGAPAGVLVASPGRPPARLAVDVDADAVRDRIVEAVTAAGSRP